MFHEAFIEAILQISHVSNMQFIDAELVRSIVIIEPVIMFQR